MRRGRTSNSTRPNPLLNVTFNTPRSEKELDAPEFSPSVCKPYIKIGENVGVRSRLQRVNCDDFHPLPAQGLLCLCG